MHKNELNRHIIQTKNIGKEYSKGKVLVSALKKIDLSIEYGEFISITGKSGSGKSTLLNLFGGLDKPSAGELHIKGKSLNKMNGNELARYRKYTVGMIFQSFNLFSSRTAMENITLALAFGDVHRKNRKQKAIELLNLVGLTHRAYHKPSEISGGEAQRVAIARALANDPEIILADEPTGNLDSFTSAEIISILLKLNKEHGKTIIMVTHDDEAAAKISDRVIRLKDGIIFNT